MRSLSWKLVTSALVGVLVLQVWLFWSYHVEVDDAESQFTRQSNWETEIRQLVEENKRLRQALNKLELQSGLHSAESVLPEVTGSLVSASASLQLPVTPPMGTTVDTQKNAVFPAGNEDTACVGTKADVKGVVAAVVVVAFNRPDYLEKTLGSLLAVHQQETQNKQRFPVFVSQDGDHQGVADMIMTYIPTIKYIKHKELKPPVMEHPNENMAYYRIANHYKFIMKTVLDCFQYPKLIIVEDDMEFAPDFFSFFQAGAQLLDHDSTLWCISSWNDNGQVRYVKNATRLYRSDFFPGLGWMLSRQLWHELGPIWPKGYWDDWMRLQKVRKGRQCVRPEVCRTYNFGEHGSSKGQFHRLYLSKIKLNTEKVDWQHMDMSYLDPLKYEKQFNATISSARTVTKIDDALSATSDVKLTYSSQWEFERYATRLGIMKDLKDGIPRASYHGVVVLQLSNHRIYVAPGAKFQSAKPTAHKAAILKTNTHRGLANNLVHSRKQGSFTRPNHKDLSNQAASKKLHSAGIANKLIQAGAKKQETHKHVWKG